MIEAFVPNFTNPFRFDGSVVRPLMYRDVDVSADLDWKKWSEFHEAVIQPLVNAGADVKVLGKFGRRHISEYS